VGQPYQPSLTPCLIVNGSVMVIRQLSIFFAANSLNDILGWTRNALNPIVHSLHRCKFGLRVDIMRERTHDIIQIKLQKQAMGLIVLGPDHFRSTMDG
jgi:hypothetical protein